MEWLLAHVDEDIPKEVPVADEAPKGDAGSSEPSSASTSAPPPAEAKSIKCNECNKLFRSQLEVEFHASKSGHSDFSESTEEKKPLSEEEKRDQMAKLEEKLKLKRLEREAKELEEKLEREKLRIKSGKDMAEARRKIEEDEMKKIVAQRKREKEEERLLREKVKAQIEADRQARKLKDSKEAGIVLPPTPVVAPSLPTGTKTAPKDYTHTRIQIRMTDGSSVVESFDVKEQLAAVRLFVQMKQGPTIPFSLMTNFPKRVFTEEDFEKPLEVLGLVPSAVLIVTKPQ